MLPATDDADGERLLPIPPVDFRVGVLLLLVALVVAFLVGVVFFGNALPAEKVGDKDLLRESCHALAVKKNK